MSTPDKAMLLFEKFLEASDEVKISLLLELKGKDGGLPLDRFFGHFLVEESGGVCKAMVEYLSYVNDRAMVPQITRFISHNQLHERVEGLVIACWQSSLDFSQHLDVFVDLLIGSDYQLALESFSVIENAIHALSPSQREALIATINSGIGKADAPKQSLLREMCSMLESF